MRASADSGVPEPRASSFIRSLQWIGRTRRPAAPTPVEAPRIASLANWTVSPPGCVFCCVWRAQAIEESLPAEITNHHEPATWSGHRNAIIARKIKGYRAYAFRYSCDFPWMSHRLTKSRAGIFHLFIDISTFTYTSSTIRSCL